MIEEYHFRSFPLRCISELISSEREIIIKSANQYFRIKSYFHGFASFLGASWCSDRNIRSLFKVNPCLNYFPKLIQSAAGSSKSFITHQKDLMIYFSVRVNATHILLSGRFNTNSRSLCKRWYHSWTIFSAVSTKLFVSHRGYFDELILLTKCAWSVQWYRYCT